VFRAFPPAAELYPAYVFTQAQQYCSSSGFIKKLSKGWEIFRVTVAANDQRSKARKQLQAASDSYKHIRLSNYPLPLHIEASYR